MMLSLLAGENTTDAGRQLTWHEDPDPAPGFVQSQGCAHVQPVARSGPEATIHPRNNSVQGSTYQPKPFIFSFTEFWMVRRRCESIHMGRKMGKLTSCRRWVEGRQKA